MLAQAPPLTGEGIFPWLVVARSYYLVAGDTTFKSSNITVFVQLSERERTDSISMVNLCA